jgi:predicted molibdopterin-dependent oxidoreductase YjgC
VDKAHPFITLDPNKCIACGRCVRTCSEILKVSALGFVYRGFKSVVRPSMEKKLLETNCISCGNCISACPTGAIAEHLPFAKPGPWAGKKQASICHFCSVGCVLQYKVFDQEAFSAEGSGSGSHNKGYLCHKGRFAYRYMLDEQRLLKPMLKGKNGWQETSWDKALDQAAKKINAISKKYGPEAVAVFGSPRLANEELYLLQKWVRTGFKTNMIGSFSHLLNGRDLDALDEMHGLTVSTTTMDEFKNADVIMVMNAELTENNLVAELKIKEAMKKGARLVAVSSSENALSKIADLWLDPKRGTNTALLAGLANALIKEEKIDRDFINRRTENFPQYQASIAKLDRKKTIDTTGVNPKKFDQIVAMLCGAPNLIIVYGVDQCLEKSQDDLKALGNLLLQLGKSGQPGNGLILISEFANSQGLLDMGADPRYLPGAVRNGDAAIGHFQKLWNISLDQIFKPVDFGERFSKGKIKALIIFGENPLASAAAGKWLAAVEFKLVADFFMTASTSEANVLLPASTPLESTGTFTACDRRVQRSPAIFPPKNGMENWEIICRLAEKTATPMQFKTTDDIFKEIQQANPFYQNVEMGGFWGKNLFRESFHTSSGKGKFLPLTIEVTTCNQEKQPLLSSENYIQIKIKNKLVV